MKYEVGDTWFRIHPSFKKLVVALSDKDFAIWFWNAYESETPKIIGMEEVVRSMREYKNQWSKIA
tara:strand:- start:5199 stop:5393 length:195 start_codon:yes stop_codon:yes gene_type:complete